MLRRASLLVLVLLCASPPVLAAQGAAVQEAVNAFVRAAALRDKGERQAALEALVATAHGAAVPPLAAEFARASSALRDARDASFRLRYVLDHRRAVLADLELRAGRDNGLERAVQREREDVAKLEQDLAKQESTAADLAAWHGALGAASPRLFGALAPADLRKADDELWRQATDSEDLEARLGAVDLLGWVGGTGTASEAAKLIEAVSKERALLRRDFSKERQELKLFEARLQKEQEQLGGRLSPATHDQYERARAQAARIQRSLTLTAYLLDAASQAGGRALAREQGRDLERSLSGLLRAQRGAKEGARLRLLDLLGKADSERVRAALREVLSAEKDPAAQAELFGALVAGGDREIVNELLAKWLLDPNWHVRSRAAASLAQARHKDAIPVLIERLALEKGRLRTDFEEALGSLTGRKFHGNVELWRRWWAQHGETFVVPELEPQEEVEASEDAREAQGTEFFGIRTQSERVLFVCDLSGSMKFSMVPRNNPGDDMSREPDLPREGESSRLAAAQLELIRALGGIPDGGTFNFVLYASDVWTWQDRLATMRDDTRAAAVSFVEKLDALGGTNIHGALELALDFAGAKAGDGWDAPSIDTIFLLSDGRATVGVTIDPDEILAFVRERNRSAGIVIHCIGLSGAQDAYLLRNLAEQNGGRYVSH